MRNEARKNKKGRLLKKKQRFSALLVVLLPPLQESALAGIDPGTHIWSEPPDDPKSKIIIIKKLTLHNDS